jgi:hypothetical protein
MSNPPTHACCDDAPELWPEIVIEMDPPDVSEGLHVEEPTDPDCTMGKVRVRLPALPPQEVAYA